LIQAFDFGAKLFRCVADGVFHTADGILYFAFGLLRGTFGLQLGVAGHFAGGFLDCTAGLLGRTGKRSLSIGVLRYGAW
jgi:hypothetical protein